MFTTCGTLCAMTGESLTTDGARCVSPCLVFANYGLTYTLTATPFGPAFFYRTQDDPIVPEVLYGYADLTIVGCIYYR